MSLSSEKIQTQITIEINLCIIHGIMFNFHNWY